MIIGLRRIKLKVKRRLQRRKDRRLNNHIKEINTFSEKITEIEFNENDEDDEFDKFDTFMDEKVILGKLQQYQEVRIVRDKQEKEQYENSIHVKDSESPIPQIKRQTPNIHTLKNIKNISDSNLPFKRINNKIKEAKINKVKVTNLDKLDVDICQYKIKFYYLRKMIITYLVIILIKSLLSLWVKAPESHAIINTVWG